jgi:hypothetical protein
VLWLASLAHLREFFQLAFDVLKTLALDVVMGRVCEQLVDGNDVARYLQHNDTMTSL